MIDLAAVRSHLAGLVETQLGDRIRVYRGYIDATAEFPLATIGVPRWTPDVQPCTDRVQLPVVLAVDQQVPNSQDVLEAYWSELVDGLREDLKVDPTLAGLVRTAQMAGAEFGALSVQGRDYPAMNTNLDLYSISI